MKKFVTIVFICMLMIIMTIPVVKASSNYTIELKVTKNEKEESFELYMLLPESYITYVINKAGLDIEYTGPETLMQNEIPFIDVDKSKVQDKTYSENGIEYVQILLESDVNNVYTFEIIADYPEMDMKLRVKNDEKDYIMHIDNFKVENDVCQIEYDYDKNEIKQPTKVVINFGTLLLIIILIMIIIIAIISKVKTKEKLIHKKEGMNQK